MTKIPRNSLKGAAIFCLLINLFEKFKYLVLVLSNLFMKKFSDKKVLIIFIPLIVSSVIDDNLSLASRNVPYISLVKANSCSVKDLFDNELILIDVSGLEDLSNRFGGKN